MKKNNDNIENIENGDITETDGTAAKKSKTFTKKQMIISIVIAMVLTVVICLSAVCIANDFNPISYSISVITNDKDKIIGKWQSRDMPGLSAYEFHEDGDYDSYISSFNFSGKYEIKGNKLTLINTKSQEEIVYRFSVNGDTLSLTLIEDANANDVKDDETIKFDRVDTLNQKSIADMLGDLKQDMEETTEKE